MPCFEAHLSPKGNQSNGELQEIEIDTESGYLWKVCIGIKGWVLACPLAGNAEIKIVRDYVKAIPAIHGPSGSFWSLRTLGKVRNAEGSRASL